MARDLPARDGPGATYLYRAAWLALLVVAAVLRATHLGDDVTYDEASTVVYFARAPWPTTISDTFTPNNHLLNSAVVKLVLLTVGDRPLAWRMPAFLAGLAVLGLTAALARRLFGRAAALVATAVVALSPPVLHFATRARGYEPALAFGLAAWWFIETARAGRGSRWRSGPSSVLFVLPLAFYDLWLTLKTEPRRWAGWLGIWAAGGALAAAGYLPAILARVITVSRAGPAGRAAFMPIWVQGPYEPWYFGLRTETTWGVGGPWLWLPLYAAGLATLFLKRSRVAILVGFGGVIAALALAADVKIPMRVFNYAVPVAAVALGAAGAWLAAKLSPRARVVGGAVVVAAATALAWAGVSRGIFERAGRSGPAPGVSRLAAALEELGVRDAPLVVLPRYVVTLQYYLEREPGGASVAFETADGVFTRRVLVLVPRGFDAGTMLGLWVAPRDAVIYDRALAYRTPTFELWWVGVAILKAPKARAGPDREVIDAQLYHRI